MIEASARFRRVRVRVFAAAFIGYAAYYLVRTNLSPIAKQFGEAMHYDKSQLGDLAMASGLAYGLGKLFLGALSDRSNARWFMPVGLLLSAGCNVAFARASGFPMHLGLWAFNGFVQGMGWAPCGRILAHWFGVSERGRAFGVWNVSHNLGGAFIGPLAGLMAQSHGWQGAFYVPALLAAATALYLLVELRDTPQSVGLPSPVAEEPPTRQQGGANAARGDAWALVLANPWMWLLALANFFAYVIRYSLLDWGPTFLQEARGATLMQGAWSTFVYEGAGLVSTLTFGWLTDRFGGRRALLGLVCLVPMAAAFRLLVSGATGQPSLGIVLFGVVGFSIYPLLMLFTIIALELTSKEAIGAAAGFIGLFGYLGKGAQAKGLGWLAMHLGWDAALVALGGVIAAECLLLVVLWARAERAPAIRVEAT